MKRNIFKALLIALVLPIAIGMTSCKEAIDSQELYVYINTEIQPINKLDLGVNVEIHKAGNIVKVVGVDSLQFNVKASRPLPAAATVTFGSDPSKLDVYNKENKVEAKLLPVEFLQIPDGGRLTIKQGEMFSDDSLEVRVTNLDQLNVEGDPTYVYPLSVTSISSDDKGLMASSNRSTIYIVVKVKSEEFSMTLTTEALMTGAPLAGSEIAVSGYSTSAKYLIDGFTTPAWNPTQSPNAWAIFDLKAERAITGFRIWPDYQYIGETIKNCGIEVSDDKVEWMSQGYVTLPPSSGSKTNPIWQYVSFDSPLTTKYVRIRSLSSYNSSYSGLSELQFYTN